MASVGVQCATLSAGYASNIVHVRDFFEIFVYRNYLPEVPVSS